MEIEKVYYLPGDLCRVRHPIDFKPVMVVKRKATKLIRPGPSEVRKDFLQGIVCYWFTKHGEYVENIFSTKDLEKL